MVVNPRPSLWIEIEDGGPGPKIGDYVVTVGKRGDGSAYLVTDSRQVKRKASTVPRYQLKTLRVPVDEARQFGPPQFYMQWFPRKRRSPLAD